MIAPRPNINARMPRNTGDSSGSMLNGPGPYLARVVNHLDRKYGGALEVELIKFSSVSNTYETDNQLRVVKYASPFYGVTPLRNNDTNDAYSSTQQSYGFWAVPPDVGSKVLVIFIEGRDDQGFWIACVQDEYMNFMIPDPRASTVLTTPSTPGDLAGRRLPVGEYNKFLANPNNNYPTSQPKPYNPDYTDRLQEQGLLEDDIRGTTSSSARREAPSNVYGMSTPGPLDKRDGAPRSPRGAEGTQANVFNSRLGGHSIVMDDGDESILRRGSASLTPSEYVTTNDNNFTEADRTLPANELFRIRTRTGHQILLHNTEDLIYISNGRGTTWIELTSNGKIDIYAQDSVSIHSAQDLNFTADRDINFTARENMNVNIGNNYKNTIGGSYSLTSADFCAFLAGNSLTMQTDSYFSVLSKASSTIQATEDLSLVTSGSAYLSSNTEVNISSDANLNIGSKADLNISTQSNLLMSSVITNMTSSGSTLIKADASLHQKAGIAVFTDAGASMNIKAGANIFAQSGAKFNILANGAMAVQATGGKLTLDGGSNVEINGGNSASPATAADAAAPALSPSFAEPQTPVTPFEAPPVARIPEHEPWLQHENLDPLQFVPERTRAGEQQTDVFRSPVPDTFVRVVAQPGTTGASYRSPAYGMPDGSTGPLPEAEDSEYTDQGLGSEATGPIAPLLSMIRLAEANNNYNAIWGGITYPPPRTLTTLTIQEVLDWQRLATSAAYPQRVPPTSSAAGAYQVVQDTLRGIYASAGLTLSSVYNNQNQDAIAIALLERRGLSRFRSGQLSLPDFANNIAKEWASFPVVTTTTGHRGQRLNPGQSYYDGVGANSATSRFTYRDVIATLEQMRGVSRGAGAPPLNDLPPGATGGGGPGNSGRVDGTVPSGAEVASGVPTGGLRPTNGQLRVFYDFTIEDYRRVSPAELRSRSGNQLNRARPMRIQDRLFQILNDAAHASGIDEVRVYSGGQITAAEASALGAVRVSGSGVTMAVGGQRVRTGSTRHDGGRAADIYLKKNGRTLNANNSTDRQAMTAFFVYAAQLGLHTAAHPYMGPTNFHVDCHSNLAAHYSNTSRWLIDAMNEGKRRR